MKKKILVRGPALSASGYGEQTRFALRALRAHEDRFDIYLQNLKWGNTGWITSEDEERDWLDFLIGKTQVHTANKGQYDISLQVTIPNEFDKLAPVNIGYTAGIETTKIAPHWIEKCKQMDKVIVVSNHAKFGFDNTEYTLQNKDTGETFPFRNQTPVEVVNYAVRDVEPIELELDLQTDFNFLTVAQWGPRKNVEATLKGFLEEFKDEKGVGLILKTSIAKNNLNDREHCQNRIKNFLSKYEDRKCKVYLLHGDLSEGEMASLYTNPKIKAIVSTTHGEGFGLPLFEAAYSCLPVIAPNWSGQTDFLYAPVKDKKKNKVKRRAHFMKVDYELKHVQKEAVWEGVIQADSMWCFTKENSLRIALGDVYKNHDQKLSVAKKLQKYLKEEFTEEKKFAEFADAVFKPDEKTEEWLEKVGEISEI